MRRPIHEKPRSPCTGKSGSPDLERALAEQKQTAETFRLKMRINRFLDLLPQPDSDNPEGKLSYSNKTAVRNFRVHMGGFRRGLNAFD